MIDLHTHILPNVDDGASSLALAIEMVEEEINNNVDEIILTPHYFKNEFNFVDKNKLIEAFNTLKKECSHLNIKLTLGAELYFSKEVFSELKSHNSITLGDTNYVLIEFSLIQCFYDIVSIIDELVYLGYRPILAHPERYNYLSIKDIENIVNLGGFIQINTSSILGDFGHNIKKKTEQLLKHKLVHFVSSDCHDMSVRKPNLKKTLELIKKKYKIEFNNNIYEW